MWLGSADSTEAQTQGGSIRHVDGWVCLGGDHGENCSLPLEENTTADNIEHQQSVPLTALLHRWASGIYSAIYSAGKRLLHGHGLSGKITVTGITALVWWPRSDVEWQLTTEAKPIFGTYFDCYTQLKFKVSQCFYTCYWLLEQQTLAQRYNAGLWNDNVMNEKTNWGERVVMGRYDALQVWVTLMQKQKGTVQAQSGGLMSWKVFVCKAHMRWQSVIIVTHVVKEHQLNIKQIK